MNTFSSYLKIGKNILIVFLAELLLCLPILPLVPQTVKAADTTLTTEASSVISPRCPDLVPDEDIDDIGEVPVTKELEDAALTNADDEDAAVFLRKDSPILSNLPNKAYSESLLNTYGIYSEENQGWTVCTADLDNFLSLVPIEPTTQQYFAAIVINNPRIAFKNKFDEYAITGDPCHKPMGSGCDETLGDVPVLGDDGKQIMIPVLDDAGKEVKNPDGTTQTVGLTEKKPLYFEDKIPNPLGIPRWDAPKVDIHILKSLVFLVTPIEKGGGGRERIQVSKITQYSKNNPELSKFFTNNDSSETPDPNDDQPVLRPECGTGVYSTHYYDSSSPSAPSCVATAMDIDQIDNIRVTTKITKKKRVGGNSVSYQYKQFPIKVAWQTQAGVSDAKNGPPPVDLFSGAGINFNASILDILDEFGMDVQIDPDSTDINSIGDLARALGESLLGQLINGPGASLSGFDLPSTLEKFGRAFLAKELGLVPGALAETDGDIVQNIGRNTVEYNFGFARGSLKGTTSDEIYSNVGRRYIEDKVLKISAGSLTASSNGPISNRAQFLQRIGEGRVEKAFGLLPQALRGKNSFQEVKGANLKTQFIFDSSNSGEVDDRLYLAFIPSEAGSTTDLYGFTESQFTTPTAKFISGQLSAADYFQLIGSRAISSTIGQFTSQIDNSVCMQSSGTSGFAFSGVTGCNPSGFVGNSPCANIPAQFADSNPFDACDINNLYTAMNQKDPLTNQTMVEVLQAAGAFSNSNGPSLGDVVSRLQKINQDKSFYIGAPDTNFTNFNKHLVEIEQAIDNPDAKVGWSLIFQNALRDVQTKLDENAKNDDTPTDEVLRQAESFLLRATTLTSSFRQAMAEFIRQEGQSGRSAALNLSGNQFRYNDQGQLTEVSTGSDPINTLLNGDLTVFPLIGRQIASKLITTDGIAQLGLQSKLLTDLSLTFKPLDQLGLSSPELRKRGLEDGDLQRIFQKGLSTEVFERVGQSELLRTAWNKSNIASAINENVSGSNTGVIGDATKLVEQYKFYADRLDRLNSLAGEVSTLSAQLADAQARAASAQQLKTLSGQDKPGTADSIRTKVQDYEMAFNNYKDLADNTSQGKTIKKDVTEATQIIREIVAGHALDFSENPDSGSNSSSAGCWSPQGIREVISLTGTQRQTSFASLARNSAACRLDQAVGLPNGSLKNWVNSNSYTFDSLCTAIGKALNPESNQSDKEAHDAGEKILRSRAAALMGAIIPGFERGESRFNLSGEDLVNLLNGNADKVLAKIGALQLDAGLHWKAGTAANLVNLTCKTTDNPPKDIQCTAEQAKNLRLRTMAQLGLSEIGINLDFPSSLDIMGSGSLVENYGRARISEGLGLAENTFQGGVDSVLGTNAQDVFMSAFGINDTPYIVKAVALLQQVDAATTRLGGDSDQDNALYTASAALRQYITEARQREINSVKDERSQYWDIGVDISAGETNSSLDRQTLAQALSDLVGNSVMTTEVINIVKPTMDELFDHDDAYWGHLYGETYYNNYKFLQSHTIDLDSRFNANAGTFKQFLTGKIAAEGISKNQAKKELEGKLLTDLYNKIPDGLLKDLVSGLTAFTGANCTPANMVLQLSSSSKCGLAPIGEISLDKIFSGDKAYETQRLYLFDHFLARSFGTKLEEIAHLRPGVIRNMIADPNRAPEIAFGEGLNMIAAKLFQSQAEDDPKIITLKNDLHQAFLAGFYDTSCNTSITPTSQFATCNTYTFKFNSDRAKTNLMASLNSTLDSQIGAMSTRKFGVAITRNDLLSLVSGNSAATLTFLGAQEFAFQLNKTLDDLTDSRSAAFKISYLDIRNAFAPSQTLTPAEISAIRAETTDKFNHDPQFNFCAVRKSSFCDGVLQDQIKIAEDKYIENRTKAAQERLQYGMYDIAAFKFDHNIPAGFSLAMFKGTSADRIKMIGEYGFNALGLKDTFKGFLTDQQFGALIDLATSKFKDPAKAKTALESGALNGLQNWVSQQFKGIFGIELPQGTILGFAAWASTGFKGNTFMSDKISFGGQTVPALGSVLRTFATSKLFAWGDKTLGFPAGSVYNIYQAYKAFQAAQAAYDSAVVDEAFAWLGGDPEDIVSAGEATDQAKIGVKQAEGALISLVITLVASKQIANIESSLGLVPGTGAIAVGIIVNLLIGAPVSPISIALFIGINLFGVYKVTVDIRGSQDGYYPYTPEHDYHYPLAPGDAVLGEFDAKNPVTYRAGIMAAAQNKVHGLLQDLLVMPDQWGHTINEDPDKLWISQVFTLSNNENKNPLQELDRLISQPAPWESPKGTGYGDILKRIQVDTIQNGQAKPLEGYYSGFFPDDRFADHIHVRW